MTKDDNVTEIIGYRTRCNECDENVSLLGYEKLKAHLDIKHFGWMRKHFTQERIYKDE